MPSEDTKILEFNQYQKSDKDECNKNRENSSITKVSEHISSGFSIPTISSFRSIENKHEVYRGKYCMKKFCEFLSGQAMKVINFTKQIMKLSKNISYILQFIDSARFMASSLSNLVNNFSEGIHRIKCKYGHDDKKVETSGI